MGGVLVQARRRDVGQDLPVPPARTRSRPDPVTLPMTVAA